MVEIFPLVKNRQRRHGMVGGVVPTISFSPDDIATLAHWYDASDITTITKDGSDRVSQWDDKKGDENLLQATGGTQPLWLSASQNGLDTIDFVSDRQMQVTDGTIVVQPQSFYIVFEFPAINNTTTMRFFNNETNDQQLLHSGVSDRITIDSGIALTFVEALSTTWVIARIIFNGASSSLFIDGVSKISGDTGTDSADGMVVMGSQVPGDFGQSDVGEMLRYDAVLSSDDNASVMTYLADRWGISI